MKNTVKTLLENNDSVVFPGVYDAVSGLVAQKAGFKLVFMSGYSTSASHLGLPDMGFLNQTDMVGVATRICSAIDIAVIVDADTGYGNEQNVRQTVRQLIQAGAKGCFLEDQNWPKRCGHMQGKEVIPREEFASKLAAAVAEKSGADFFIVARTDAIATDGIAEALTRMNLAKEAGVDGFFIEAPQDIATMQHICNEAPRPLVANLIEGGKTPVLGQKEIQEMGYSLILYPLTALYSATKAMTQTLTKLQQQGISDDSQLVKFDEFNELIGASDLLRDGK